MLYGLTLGPSVGMRRLCRNNFGNNRLLWEPGIDARIIGKNSGISGISGLGYRNGTLRNGRRPRDDGE